MTNEELENYKNLIAIFQERYDYDDCIDLIDVVTSIYGYSKETLDNLNFYFTGYNSYDQLKELEEEEKD